MNRTRTISNNGQRNASRWGIELPRTLNRTFHHGGLVVKPADSVGTAKIKIRVSRLPIGGMIHLRPAARAESVGLLLAGSARVRIAEACLEMTPGHSLSIPSTSNVELKNVGPSACLLSWFETSPGRTMNLRQVEEGTGGVAAVRQRSAFLMAPGEAPSYPARDLPAMIHVAGPRVSNLQTLDLWIAELAPGRRVPLHLHRHRDEVFLILSGHGTAMVGGVQTPVKAGQMLFAPANIPHGIQNPGSAVLLLAASHSPPHEESDHWPVHEGS